MSDEKNKISEENLKKVLAVAMAGRITVNNILNNYKREYGKDSLTSEACFNFGVKATKDGIGFISKEFFISGSAFQLTSKLSHYNSPEIIDIGRCLTMLVTQYPLDKNAHDIIFKTTALAYIYLSHSIEMYKDTAQDAHMVRAVLFRDHKDPETIREMLCELSIGILVEPFIISDCYIASMSGNSRYPESYSMAEDVHDELDCISINGKDADEYSIEEISKIGEKRHLLLFKEFEQKYMNGNYNMSIEDLYKIIDDYYIINEDMKNIKKST